MTGDAAKHTADAAKRARTAATPFAHGTALAAHRLT